MNDDIASRLYPNQASANTGSAPPKTLPPGSSDQRQDLAFRMFPSMGATTDPISDAQNGSQAPALTDHQLSPAEALSADESLSERMYADGGPVLDSPEAYSGAALGATFDQLEHQARHDGNEPDAQALAEGRREASALLFEWSVPADHAHEIAMELSAWHDRWMRDELPSTDQIVENGAKALSELRKTWGSQFDANLAFARTAYQQASKRLPWLADLVDSGAGNSAVLIKQFAAIGRRQARAARTGQKQSGNRR
ncbi:hypothetical protein HIV01_004255 [Lysobacter arenosi]|uniref:Uncharacterized protein n=1 Tax=Lysobacter arenosi TaxID=2795387 RepID=A0ABX7RC67_9GAMM|nr:hypothetical protein [Lysobacter arenosi]QSX75744.1 hypothetical protein HIV01_004255 [Lysobacter arenosi]